MGELAPCSARQVLNPVCAKLWSLFRDMFDPKWQCGIHSNSYLFFLHQMLGYLWIENNQSYIEKVTWRHTGVSEFGTRKMLKSGTSSSTYNTTLCTLWYQCMHSNVPFIKKPLSTCVKSHAKCYRNGLCSENMATSTSKLHFGSCILFSL